MCAGLFLHAPSLYVAIINGSKNVHTPGAHLRKSCTRPWKCAHRAQGAPLISDTGTMCIQFADQVLPWTEFSCETSSPVDRFLQKTDFSRICFHFESCRSTRTSESAHKKGGKYHTPTQVDSEVWVAEGGLGDSMRGACPFHWGRGGGGGGGHPQDNFEKNSEFWYILVLFQVKRNHFYKVVTRQGKMREKWFFSSLGKCQGISKFVREK